MLQCSCSKLAMRCTHKKSPTNKQTNKTTTYLRKSNFKTVQWSLVKLDCISDDNISFKFNNKTHLECINVA